MVSKKEIERRREGGKEKVHCRQQRYFLWFNKKNTLSNTLKLPLTRNVLITHFYAFSISEYDVAVMRIIIQRQRQEMTKSVQASTLEVNNNAFHLFWP